MITFELEQKVKTAKLLNIEFLDHAKKHGFEGFALDFQILLESIEAIELELRNHIQKLKQ